MLATSSMMTNELRRIMQDGCGLTLPQFDYLAQLEREQNRGLTLSEIANRLMVTGGNVTGLTDRLQNDGLVYREPDPSDRRSLRVFMTKAGEKRMRQAAKIHEEWINTVMQDMRGQDLDALSEGLDAMRESYKSYRAREDLQHQMKKKRA